MLERDTTEVVSGIGKPGNLGPEECGDLDVIAPACLVAKGLKPDSGARGGGRGLSDDALGTLVPGHAP